MQQPIETLQVQLPKDMIHSLNQAVASGAYHTPSEAVYSALVQWQEHRAIAVAELRRLCEAGVVSGLAEPFTLEELLAETLQKKTSR